MNAARAQMSARAGAPEASLQDRYITESECHRMSGLPRVTRWRMEKRGEFPQRRRLSPNRVGWLASEVFAWMESRPVSDIPAPGSDT